MDALLKVSPSSDDRAFPRQPLSLIFLERCNAFNVLSSSVSWAWRCYKTFQDPYRFFIISRRNYKVYAGSGPDTQRLKWVGEILDTGA